MKTELRLSGSSVRPYLCTRLYLHSPGRKRLQRTSSWCVVATTFRSTIQGSTRGDESIMLDAVQLATFAQRPSAVVLQLPRFLTQSRQSHEFASLLLFTNGKPLSITNSTLVNMRTISKKSLARC